MEERWTDVRVPDRAKIGELIRSGTKLILQYSKPPYATPLLRTLNDLCEKHGDKITVRFYGHYSSCFDARILKHLPSVVNLVMDCLRSAIHLEEVWDLRKLRSLSLGVYELDRSDILSGENLRHLTYLVVGDTKKTRINLLPVSEMRDLNHLRLVGQPLNIDAIASLPKLSTLALTRIPKSTRLTFINGLSQLRDLEILLGGRSSIAELQHPTLQQLSIVRVLGFSDFNSAGFPGLLDLKIEDQTRLLELSFGRENKRLESLSLHNCKSLKSLKGLRQLEGLTRLGIYRTSLDIDQLHADGLPPGLVHFRFGTGKVSVDRRVQSRLSAAGFQTS